GWLISAPRRTHQLLPNFRALVEMDKNMGRVLTMCRKPTIFGALLHHRGGRGWVRLTREPARARFCARASSCSTRCFRSTASRSPTQKRRRRAFSLSTAAAPPMPQPATKTEARGFFIVTGGCAANAAVAVARLGARAALAGPLGDDANG